MKTIIVGDLHGRIEIAEQLLKEDCNIVFIGDYLDSFDRSIEDQLKLLSLIRTNVQESNGRIKALLGNHELSYIEPSMRASGYNYDTAATLRANDFEYFLNYVWVDDFLISHAGVSGALLKNKECTLDNYLKDEDFLQIGRRRGGRDEVGGLFWCDWFSEFDPLPDTPQVVGHSGYRPKGEHEGILQKDNSFNIDCFQYTKEVLVIEDNQASIMKLE